MLFGEGINADFIATPLREKEQEQSRIDLALEWYGCRDADHVIDFDSVLLLCVRVALVRIRGFGEKRAFACD